MADPTWLGPLERAVNRRVNESETAGATLATLRGRRFGVRVLGLPGMLRLAAGDEGLSLELAGDGAEVDASVTASVVALAALAGREGESLVRNARATVNGDAETARGFQRLLEAAAPDWEEELSRVIGDIAAHQFARSAREARDLSAGAIDSVARRVTQWLQQEGAMLASAEELATFAAAVDRLRDDTERLAARIARLERRRDPGSGSR